MDKADFVNEAIKDCQSTIRAIDVKVGALLVGLLTPIANTHRVFHHFDHLLSHQYFSLLVVVFVTTWIAALIALVRAIGAISNPASHIINIDGFKGSFYGAGLYHPEFWDVFFDREVLTAKKDPKSFMDFIPHQQEDIYAELVFEHMKIVYIREIKLNRLKWGLRFSLVWLGSGIAIYLISRYFIG